jgi:hypothetical protein
VLEVVELNLWCPLKIGGGGGLMHTIKRFAAHLVSKAEIFSLNPSARKNGVFARRSKWTPLYQSHYHVKTVQV